MILGQDTFHVIRPFDYFEADQRDTTIAVQLPSGRVLSKPLLLLTSRLFATCFKVVRQFESGFKLADHIRSSYDMESFGAYKQVDPCSVSDASDQKILKNATYHDGCQYHFGMLWANDKNNVTKFFFWP